MSVTGLAATPIVAAHVSDREAAGYVQDYADAKTGVVRAILARAALHP